MCVSLCLRVRGWEGVQVGEDRQVSRALLHLVDDSKQRVQREKVRGEEVVRGGVHVCGSESKEVG